MARDLLRETDQLRELVGDNNLERAANRTLDYLRNSGLPGSLQDSAILIKSEIAALEQTRRRGTEDPEVIYRRERSTKTSLLDLLNSIDLAEPDSLSARQGLARSPTFQVENGPPHPRLPISSAPGEVAFTAENLSFRFQGKSGQFRLKVPRLELRLGQVTALLGANASGKSTLQRVVAGELAAEADTFEYPLVPGPSPSWYQIKRRIAFIEQVPQPWPLKLIDVLRFEAAAHRIPGGDTARNAVENVISRLQLAPFVNMEWQALSGGYRTRFELARALLRQSQILILDEPLAHLDPVVQLNFLQDVRDLASNPRMPVSILISSQHVAEAEAIADQVIFLQDGAMKFVGSLAELATQLGFVAFEFECDAPWSELQRSLAPFTPQLATETCFRRIVKLSIECSPELFLGTLARCSTDVRYFRDLSRSTRILFL